MLLAMTKRCAHIETLIPENVKSFPVKPNLRRISVKRNSARDVSFRLGPKRSGTLEKSLDFGPNTFNA